MINKKRILEKFLQYVQIDSPTKEELEFAKVLMEELEELGFEVEMDNAGESVGSNSGNVIGRLKGTTDSEPILLTAHMDTVSPGRGIKPIIKDGIIYSDGTTILGGDDKAGIAAILEAIESIKENEIQHGDLEVVFTIFEEGGLYGVKGLDHDKIKSKNIFVLDSGGSPGEIIVKGPAQNKLDIEFIGKTAHAGVAPEMGISAISIASEAISNMNLLRIDEETTANIGIISGGEATNIVAESVKVEAEARSLQDGELEKQTKHMVDAAEAAAKKFGGSVNIEIDNIYKAFEVDSDSEIVKKVEEACGKLGFETETKSTGGGSDTNIWNEHGFNAVNLGVGMQNPHTVEECIEIKDLENSARMVIELIKLYA